MANTAGLRFSGTPNDKVASLAPDEVVFERLLQTHLPRVRFIVDRIKRRLPSSVDAEDLYSIGVTGLVAAARNYQPDQERGFGSYANTRIRGAILDELRRMDSMSRSKRSKARQLGNVISKLEQEQGGSVCRDSLCAEMNLTEGALAELQEDVREVRFISLDEDQGELEDQSLHDIIPDDSVSSALDMLERKEILSLLAQRMAKLPETPKKVLAMYYHEGMKLSEIAACFGLTESRISQIHTQTVAVLRSYLANMLA
ncbi:MAG: FliA/WhiG family RNA polymerase sigma factor [Verrucomicrobia bacterium]|nr:FliA/WhiG family RNA polymerase sigma factor [Verrucomicrobiota bacterium]